MVQKLTPPKKKVSSSRVKPSRKTASKSKPAAKKAAAKKKGRPGRKKVYAKNQHDLAAELGISRSTVSRLVRRPDCPRPTADGKYHIEKWREFYKGTGGHQVHGEDPDIAKQKRVKTRLAEIALEEKELELSLKSGETIDLETATTVLGSIVGEVVQAIRDSDNSTAPDIVGMTVPNALKRLREDRRTALRHVTVPDHAKKKPRDHDPIESGRATFFTKLSKKLPDLPAMSLLGPGQSNT